jgi:hypothetical protein
VSHVSPVRVVVGAAAMKVTLYQVPGFGHTLEVFLTWSKKRENLKKNHENSLNFSHKRGGFRE